MKKLCSLNKFYFSLKDLELEDRQSKLQQDMRERMAQSKLMVSLKCKWV